MQRAKFSDIPEATLKRVAKMRAENAPYRKIVADTGLSLGTVVRIVKAADTQNSDQTLTTKRVQSARDAPDFQSAHALIVGGMQISDAWRAYAAKTNDAYPLNTFYELYHAWLRDGVREVQAVLDNGAEVLRSTDDEYYASELYWRNKSDRTLVRGEG
jgi:hypothetical protein